MSRISFEGIGEVAATFACGEGVKAGQVVNVTNDLPKSFVLCEEGGQVRVYITQVSSSTLRKRAAFFQGIANL